MLLRDRKAYSRTFSKEKTKHMCVSVLWEERMQAGNWVAEELAKEQERKMVKTETRQWNYYFSSTRETELKMPFEFLGW